MHAQNAHHIIEQVPLFRALESVLLACLGEWLARKAGAKQVVRWDIGDVDLTDIPSGPESEVLSVDISENVVDFTGEHARVSQLT